MRIGKLRHRVTLEAPGQTQDPNTGEMTPGWQPVATVWASVEPLSARDFIAAQASQSEITARIVMRYREGITPEMRAVHRGRPYKIHGVLPDAGSGRHYLTLPVSEGVSDGS
jgi:SPP1 family predicted phage head-tail adaptor